MTEKEKVNEAKRAAIYVRLSTADQEIYLQETELKEYCERRGWHVVIYRDRGESGLKEDRPALNALLSDLWKQNPMCWLLDHWIGSRVR